MLNEKDLEFFKQCKEVATNGGTMEDLMKLTGLKRTTLVQKRSVLRAAGLPIPEFRKGRAVGSGTVKTVTEEDLQKIAEITGQTLEQVKAASEATKASVTAHAEKVRAGKLAKANAANTETNTSESTPS